MLEKSAEKRPVILSLFERRVPQILGVYLGMAWVIIEFMGWLVERYEVNANLLDIALLILTAMLPSVLVVAYYHGRPGRDEWTSVEKITIPVNVFFAIGLLAFLELGQETEATEVIVVDDEHGVSIEKLVAKESYRHKIDLYNFENTGNTLPNNWFNTAIPFALRIDLLQDIFVEPHLPLAMGPSRNNAKRAGFDQRDTLPLPLMQQLAKENFASHFIAGHYSINEAGISAEVNIYETESGNTLKTQNFSSNNFFFLIDEISQFIKTSLNIPNLNQVDLPASDIITKDTEAFRYLILAEEAMQTDAQDKAEKTLALLNQALAKDKLFALAHFMQGVVYRNNNQANKAIAAFEQALKLSYKIPELIKFELKSQYYITSGQFSKWTKLVEMQLELYPKNVILRELLATRYASMTEYDAAIKELKYIQTLVDVPEAYVPQIAELEIKKGDLRQALNYFLDYQQHYPKRIDSYLHLGNIYGLLNQIDKQKDSYEKALLIDAYNGSANLNLAEIEMKLGDFDKAYQTLLATLDRAEQSEDIVEILAELEDYHQTLGQPKAALKYAKQGIEQQREFLLPFHLAFARLNKINRFGKANQIEDAINEVKAIENSLESPFDELTSFGYLLVAFYQKDAVEARKQLIAVEKIMNEMGPVVQGLQQLFPMLQGLVLELEGNWPKAIEKLTEFSDSNLEATERFLVLGRVYRKSGDVQKAEQILQQALLENPQSGEVLLELAKVKQNKSDQPAALLFINKALSIWQHAEADYEKAIEAQKLKKELEVEQLSNSD